MIPHRTAVPHRGRKEERKEGRNARKRREEKQGRNE